jgi:hypothetical protein
MKRLIVELAMVAAIIACVIGTVKTSTVSAQAQSSQEVAPYIFAKLTTDTVIYKAVHEGCELYIVESDAYIGKNPEVAIATGRGCK